MRQRVLSLALLLFSLFLEQRVVAYDFEVNGIYYSWVPSNLTVIVTSGDTPYKGMVIIPDSVTYKGKTMAVVSVGGSAFADCSDLTSVQFGKNIGSIGDYAFNNCGKLTHLVIPSTISRIQNGAFYGCSNLKDLTFEDSGNCIAIGTNGAEKLSSAFNCKPEYLYMGRQLGKRSDYYDLDNSNLKTLIIGNQVTYISGFSGAQITTLTIPSNVETIGEAAFSNCSKLKTVIFEDGDNIISCYRTYYKPGQTGSYYNWSTFCDCPLKEVYIGRPMTTNSSSNALAWPINGTPVEKVTISESLTSLCGILNCPNLKEIDIPASVNEITGFNGCTSLTTIKCRAIIPPNIMKQYISQPFVNNTYLNGVLYVPEASIDNYKADEEWGKFFDIQKLTDNPNAKKKCESPYITYDNKKIVFSSNTPDVIFHHTITSPDIISGVNKGEIQLSALYKISVYASRADYDNSDETIAYLYWAEADLESSDIQTARANKRGVLIQNSNGFITISGLDNNETVSLYTVEGCLIGNSKSISGTAIFNVRKNEKVVIIKFGDESIKIAL